jgi:hypothetical protein
MMAAMTKIGHFLPALPWQNSANHVYRARAAITSCLSVNQEEPTADSSIRKGMRVRSSKAGAGILN